MEYSSFFNAELVDGKYDRGYNADDLSEYFSSLIGNGIFANPSSSLQVVADSQNMSVNIKSGMAFIYGRRYINTDDLPLSIQVADGVLNRIDKLVLRLDYINREIKSYVKTGKAASNPVAPEIARNSEVYELGLADIYIEKGATRISNANITDLRFNDAYCGVVKGLIEQVSTTDLFNQYNAAFLNWFDRIKGVLDEETAGNLLNLIESNTLSIQNFIDGIVQVSRAVNADQLNGLDASKYSLAHEHPYLSNKHASAAFGYSSSTGRITHNGNDVKVKDAVNAEKATNSTQWNGLKVVKTTKNAYDALPNKDSNTLYLW